MVNKQYIYLPTLYIVLSNRSLSLPTPHPLYLFSSFPLSFSPWGSLLSLTHSYVHVVLKLLRERERERATNIDVIWLVEREISSQERYVNQTQFRVSFKRMMPRVRFSAESKFFPFLYLELGVQWTSWGQSSSEKWRLCQCKKIMEIPKGDTW